jgi:hypothetical protein
MDGLARRCRPNWQAQCPPHRGRRDKPGDDVLGWIDVRGMRLMPGGQRGEPCRIVRQCVAAPHDVQVRAHQDEIVAVGVAGVGVGKVEQRIRRARAANALPGAPTSADPPPLGVPFRASQPPAPSA